MTVNRYLIAAILTAATVAAAMPVVGQDAEAIAKGRELAFDRNRGNCLSCHAIAGGEMPGNIAPPLIQMKLRFPARAKLRAQIWDATTINPNTIMPSYYQSDGFHRTMKKFAGKTILTAQEVEDIIAYLSTLK